MREAEVSVTFQPSAKTVHVLPETQVLEAAVGAAVVRLLGMELGGVTVLVDGIGA